MSVRDALSRRWDVVVVGHNLPGFSGLQALALIWQKDLDVPVLFVSGSVGEEAAVAAMRRAVRRRRLRRVPWPLRERLLVQLNRNCVCGGCRPIPSRCAIRRAFRMPQSS